MNAATVRSPFDDETLYAKPWDSGIESPNLRVLEDIPAGTLLSPLFTAPSTSLTALALINAKLRTLRALPVGWLGPGSVPPRLQAVKDFQTFLGALGSADVALRAEPVANVEGALEIEWKSDDAERVIEFTGDGLWLFESRGGATREVDVEPFDAERALSFFRGEPL